MSSTNRQFSIITLKIYTLGEVDCAWSYCAEQASSYFPSCTLHPHVMCKKPVIPSSQHDKRKGYVKDKRTKVREGKETPRQIKTKPTNKPNKKPS